MLPIRTTLRPEGGVSIDGARADPAGCGRCERRVVWRTMKSEPAASVDVYEERV